MKSINLHLRKIVQISILLLSTHALAEATPPTVSLSTKPDWVVDQETEKPRAREAVDQEIDHILFDTQFNLKNRQSTRYFRLISRPNTPSSVSKISEIGISFDPSYQKLTLHSVEIIRDDERLSRLNISDVKLIQQESELGKSIYNGSWTALIVINDLRPNDTLDYSYSIQGHNPIFGDKYVGMTQLTWKDPIDKRRVRILTDKGNNLTFRTNKKSTQIVMSKTDQSTIFELVQRNEKSDPFEDRIPQEVMPIDYLEYSEFKSWADVVGWAAPIYSFKEQGHDLDSYISERTQRNIGTEEKIQELIRFVQNDIRYFGIELGSNSHKPSEPSETFSRRFGDCKDKAALLVYALERLGISASPALVSAESQSHISDRLPSPLAFDHVIVHYIFNGNSYWVDPTFTEQAGNQKHRTLPDFKKALLIKKGTKALTEIKAAHPEQLDSFVVINENYRFLSSADPTMEIDLEMELSGWRADEVRSALQHAGTIEFEREIRDAYQQQFKRTDSISSMTKLDDVEMNKLKLKFKFRATAPHTDAAARMEYSIYGSMLRDYIVRPQILTRMHPFVTIPRTVVNQTTKIVFPDDRKIIWKSDDGKQSIDTKHFKLNREVNHAGQELQLKLSFESIGKYVQPEETSDYIQETALAIESLGLRIWTERLDGSAKSLKNEQVRNLIERIKSK